MTLAMGRPPIEGAGGFWGISAAVVDKPPPRLPVHGYSRELRDFCDCCLKNDPSSRLPAKAYVKSYLSAVSSSWESRVVMDTVFVMLEITMSGPCLHPSLLGQNMCVFSFVFDSGFGLVRLLKHAWIRKHVADSKRQNLTSTVVRNNFMKSDGPTSNEEAMSALGATWSRLSTTSKRRGGIGSAVRSQIPGSVLMFLLVVFPERTDYHLFFLNTATMLCSTILHPSRTDTAIIYHQFHLRPSANSWKR